MHPHSSASETDTVLVVVIEALPFYCPKYYKVLNAWNIASWTQEEYPGLTQICKTQHFEIIANGF